MDLIDLKFYKRRYSNSIKVWLSDNLRKIKPASDVALKNDIDKVFIKKLYFEVTNICNAKCTFCAYRKISKTKSYRPGIMSFAIFKKALDDYVASGGKRISLTPTIGDTLMDPGLLEKIEYAVKGAKVKFVYFYTNGILLGKNQMYKKLVDSGINQIEISALIADKKNYETIFGVDCYDLLLDGVRKLLDYNKSQGEPLSIVFNFRTPLLPSKTLTSGDFVKYIKPYISPKVKYTFMVSYDNWCGQIEQNDLSGEMKMKQCFLNQNTPCLRTYDAVVLFDGSIRLCGCRIKNTEFDELVVGNINENTLKEIYFGENAKKIRQRFITGDQPDVCCGCSLYDPGDFNYNNSI